MKALYDQGFPVPTPIDQNRHCVVMSMIDAVPMYTIRDMPNPQTVLERLMRLLIRLGRAGIVHGDFNEFNLLIGESCKVTLIDFPQVVHLTHANAEEFFDRDVRSIVEWFRKKCDLEVVEYPTFAQVLAEVESDNGAVLASLNVQGISRDDDALLVAAHGGASERVTEQAPDDDDDDDNDDDDDDNDDEAPEDNVDSTKQDGFAGLVPEGGCRELAEAGEEIDGPTLAEEDLQATADAGYPAGNMPAPEATNSGAEDSDDDDEDDDSGSDVSEGPGQVAIPKAPKKTTRKRQSAKEARKNLQRQQKTKPAKANNQKVREMRNARHQVKEYLA